MRAEFDPQHMAVALLHESALDGVGPRDAGEAPRKRDRRGEVRLSAEDASWLRGARLKYGPDVRVIDISAGGILVESDTALEPQSNVVIELSVQTKTMLLPARVLRSRAATRAPKVRYQTACVFKRPLTLETLAHVADDKAQTENKPDRSPAPAPQKSAWQRVVARYRNGQIVRGYTNDFHPSKPHLHVTPENQPAEALFLAVSQLKAVFFVRDFTGDPARVDRNDFSDASHGRKVEVAFEDGEVLLGTTLAYKGDGCGFFVHPADSNSNNLRVFVSPGATRHVKFL
jgi:hypothetical protein